MISNRTARWSVLLLVLAVAVSGAGCSSFVKARGRVLKDGKPHGPSRGERMKIVFFPYSEEAGEPADSFRANVMPGGTFEVPGRTGKGIPRGKYRIAIEGAGGDVGTFKSPIVRDVASSEEMVIDIANPAG